MALPPPVIYVSTQRRRRPMWPSVAVAATVLVGVAAALLRGLG